MLKIEKLSCGYGSLTVVHELDLTVREGSIHALVGANGAGKSTTLMTIAGHVQVKSGSIQISSERLDQVPTKERVRLGVALVPEGRRLFADLTVRDNLEVGGYSQPKGNISQKFDANSKHFAIDIVAIKGTPIKATADGTVIFSGWNVATGYVIILKHSKDFISVYKHNGNLLKQQGDFVKSGEVIASVGSTGELTTGPHLHFELWKGGYAVNPINFIDFK